MHAQDAAATLAAALAPPSCLLLLTVLAAFSAAAWHSRRRRALGAAYSRPGGVAQTGLGLWPIKLPGRAVRKSEPISDAPVKVRSLSYLSQGDGRYVSIMVCEHGFMLCRMQPHRSSTLLWRPFLAVGCLRR